jgi:tetratricopeptide (TPR) repeat protein
VVLTAEPGAGADAAAVRLVADAVARAVRQAAEPGSAPEQLSLAGLQTWQVKKVYAALPPGERGGLELPTAQFAPRLGCSLADAAAAPRGLLSDRFHRCEPMLGFRLLSSQASQESERADFFTGLNLPPGGEARRELGEAASEGVESLGRMAQRRRTFQAIVAQSEKNPQRGLQLLAEAGRFAEQLDDDGGAWLLEQLAEQYFETGQWELAAETRQALAERYPRHPLSRAALRWLVEYYASGEAAWRARSTQPGHLMNSSQPGGEAAQPGDRPGCAIALATRAERTQPALFADPALRFALAAAYRRQGNARQAERFYAAASRGVNHGAWRACAEGEQWLAAPRGNSPKPVLRCPAATGKPRLDGRLDDAVWRAVQPVALTSAYRDDTEWPARVMLAYDAEFLYLAITARQAPGVRYEAATGPRPRHADLSAHDRVELFLDVDRDFVSYYHFTIDDRGWAAEDCWGDRTWNPQWFVAARTENQTWTVEAAIPWNQLTGKPPQAHDAWAIGIQRIVPGVGFQSWNVPAAVEVIPEGFGYLSFQ